MSEPSVPPSPSPWQEKKDWGNNPPKARPPTPPIPELEQPREPSPPPAPVNPWKKAPQAEQSSAEFPSIKELIEPLDNDSSSKQSKQSLQKSPRDKKGGKWAPLKLPPNASRERERPNGRPRWTEPAAEANTINRQNHGNYHQGYQQRNRYQYPIDLTVLCTQLEFYFSPDNLVRDMYLRSRMDPATGFVSLEVLAAFPRVGMISQRNFDAVVQAAALSGLMELSADLLSVRLRERWADWVFPEEVYRHHQQQGTGPAPHNSTPPQ